MTRTKLTSIRLANAVKCGTEEQEYIETHYNGFHVFDLEVSGIWIRIECQKSKQVSWTTIYNMIYSVTKDNARLDGVKSEQAKPRAKAKQEPREAIARL